MTYVGVDIVLCGVVLLLLYIVVLFVGECVIKGLWIVGFIGGANSSRL
jgi:hypothetical protein